MAAQKKQQKPQKKTWKRPDSTVQSDPGDNRKYILHNMQVAALANVHCDTKSPEQVSKRIMDYFQLCADNDMKPNVAAFAMAFGINRITMWKWVNGSGPLTAETRKVLHSAYQMLNAQMEDYMQNGKINPVAGIFLMKNNMGYEDKKEVTVTPTVQMGDGLTSDELKQKYLKAVEADEKQTLRLAESAESEKIAESAESAEREIIDLEEAP